ncbi:SDR family oxidoreductase [Salinactinospora qingdaonensis]|uniref:SDR family oxidoreductase n=1 Tax=Salinactinospora qingdaonensis TaxID=702744 RepID=A0ABP7FIL9_9ACTN
MRVLVIGATGYLGIRLVPELLREGHQVRCLTRSPEKLSGQPWRGEVEVVHADLDDHASLLTALDDMEVVYHLVPAPGEGRAHARLDRDRAHRLCEAAQDRRVARIVHVDDLASRRFGRSKLARHPRDAGATFLASPVPSTVLRADVILGCGSVSFEMLRYLAERQPALVAPRWMTGHVQPIAVGDVLETLLRAAHLPPEDNRASDIGGPARLSYAEMAVRFARLAGLAERVVLPVPLWLLTLSALWVALVTPLPVALARSLLRSLRHRARHGAEKAEPSPDALADGQRLGFDDAVRLALGHGRDNLGGGEAPAGWPRSPAARLPTDPAWTGGALYVDERARRVDTPPETLWRIIEGIGGERGWYTWPLAWSARGWTSRRVEERGRRHGRRDPVHLSAGDPLEQWRVETVEPGRLLRLRGEMRLPGLAWLELHVERDGDGHTSYRQRALFHPRGLGGQLYWWAARPLHGAVFGSAARTIAWTAESISVGQPSRPVATEYQP